jgi:hypothetical protein
MVKVRPGSRKGQTKLTKGGRKVARRIGKVRSKSLVPPGPLKAAWDQKLTGNQNLERVGLTATVNDIHSSKRRQWRGGDHAVETARKLAPERIDVLKKLEYEAALPERTPNVVVRPGEEHALRGMVTAHGDDYIAMSRDIKLNYLQWTPAQLRRKCERRARILVGSNGK